MATTILRQKPYASWYFGAQAPGQLMYAIPRYKYMFYATFNVNSQALSMFPAQMLIGGQTGISFKIKTIDKPNIEVNQKELNQYNRKRYAYTKTEYRPVNISMYDTVDNKPFNLWIEYFTYYFGDARYKSPLTMGTNPTDPTFDDSTGWGLRPLVEQVNFFTSLDLYALFGKEYTLTSYLNPKISSIDWGSHDTSDSGLEDLKMTIVYETVQYDSGTITPELANQFGFDIGQPTLEPPVQSPTISAKSTGKGTGSSKNYAHNNENYTVTGDITRPSASTISAFGMSGTSYNTLVGPGSNGNFANQSPDQATGQSPYASSVGIPDTVYGSAGIGSYYSDVPIGENYGITGLPGGQLPGGSSYISLDITDNFSTVSGFGIFNLLGSFGSFNFGAGQVRSSVGSNQTYSWDPVSGTTSSRPGAPNDPGLNSALPIRFPGQRRPNAALGYHNYLNTYYGSNGPRYLTQYEQIVAARRRVQNGDISLSIAIGNPYYDNYGIYSGYNDAAYQPAPEPFFGPSLQDRAAQTNSTGGSFGYLDDPSVFGGDTSDNEPPPTVIPYTDFSSY